jgi:hypothetical protein
MFHFHRTSGRTSVQNAAKAIWIGLQGIVSRSSVSTFLRYIPFFPYLILICLLIFPGRQIDGTLLSLYALDKISHPPSSPPKIGKLTGNTLTSYKPNRRSAPSWHARSLFASPGGSHPALGQEEDGTVLAPCSSLYLLVHLHRVRKKACEYTGVPDVVGVAQRPHRTVIREAMMSSSVSEIN